MPVKVPFQYLDGLAEPARTQLQRNFEEIQTALQGLSPGVPGGSTYFDGGLELYHPSSTPYIDFHGAASPAGDSNADYDWRFIREAGSFALYKLGYSGFDSNAFRWYSDGSYHCNILGVGGDNVANSGAHIWGQGLWVESATGTNVRSNGAGAGYEFAERDATSNKWVLYATAALARLWRGGDLHWWGTDYFRSSVARMGYAGFYGNFACFAHSDRWAAGQYALLQGAGGETYLNAYTGAIYLRWQNNDKLVIDVNASSFRNRVVLNDNRIDTRGWGDDWHCAQWWSGNDGWRQTEYGGFYYRVVGSDPAFRIDSTGQSKFHRFDQIGAYDTAAILTHSSGGGTGAKVGYWSAGQNAAHIHKCWGSSIEVRNWDDGNWGYSVGDFNDVSTLRAKVPESIERMKDKLPKAQRRAKHKKIDTIKYKRPLEDTCVNCSATGKMVGRPDMLEKERNQRIAASLFGAELENCPDCNGSGKKKPDPGAQKNYDTGLFGFAAEELAPEFPEAVFFDREGLPVAVKPNALIALLWEDNKDQQEEIDALEARLAALERSPANAIGKTKEVTP